MQILHGCENGVSIEQLLENISELEREIIKEAPTDNDAEILLSSASVARHSVQYWHNNISKWHMCLNGKIVGVYEKIETKGWSTSQQQKRLPNIIYIIKMHQMEYMKTRGILRDL